MANDTHAAERLKQLHQRIEQWRRSRHQHGPMPGELWDERVLVWVMYYQETLRRLRADSGTLT